MTERGFSLEADLHSFFVEVVAETLQGRERPLPIVEQYLVGLLEDSALSLGDGPIEATLGAPLAVQLSDALHAPAAVRFEKLRRLGDGILLLGGVYEPHLKRNGLEDRYVTTLGARAYSAASSLMVPGGDALLVGGDALHLLERLAYGFSQLMGLLRDVTDTVMARSARSAGELAGLIEKWFRTRSEHLERLLRGKGIVMSGLRLAT